MKKKEHIEPENNERYIITYADLITLLLCFFVILYAMNEPKAENHQELGGYFESVFSPRAEKVSFIKEDEVRTGMYNKPLTEEENRMMKSISEQNNLRELQEKIEQKIDEEGLDHRINTNLTEDGLRIVLTDEILFESGSATINNEDSIKLLRFITKLIHPLNNKVSIEGHTDDIPISNSTFASNWELSTARSVAVLKEMISSQDGLNPVRFSAAGYGEYNPIESNNTKNGRSKNRRVEILIERIYPDGLLQPERGA